MMTIADTGRVTWAHVGDLHITAQGADNYRDFLAIIQSMNEQLAGQIDFCVLPGDNADDGTAAQFLLIRQALDRLKIPVHVIAGDHDRKPGDLTAFYRELGVPRLPYAVTVGKHRCLFLDMVSAGSGGPDFALGAEQLRWLAAELQTAMLNHQASVVFMHAYPADLHSDQQALRQLLAAHRVAFVDMGHTHYNELANDGTTIYATTRSTGQVEEGPPGFSLASLSCGVVSWRFMPLQSSWPLVMITSPADHRLATGLDRPNQLVAGEFTVTARVFGAGRVTACRCRIDQGGWSRMTQHIDGHEWTALCRPPSRQFTLAVEAEDEWGGRDTDTIVAAVAGFRPAPRRADGSDADALGAWPERHLLGTRLGPNRNGRQW
jgi:Icc protein